MRKLAFLRAALCLAATMFLLALSVGATRATAQCAPCDTWWVNYDYIFPPCVTPVSVDVDWINGQTSHVVETTDGHKIYTTPLPISAAKAVRVNGIDVPMNGTPVWLPYFCNDGMENMCLKVEVRCNPCLEIKIHLEPCPPCETWWVNYDYIFPPCTDPVPVDVQWSNGAASHVVGTTDGHIIYNVPPPASHPNSVQVLGQNVPINGPAIWIPYRCADGMINMCLKAEVKTNPCLEVKLHLEPCQ